MPLDDSAGTRSLLAERRADGEYVLHAARLVGDEEDFAIWRQSRRAWLAATADVLFAHFPSERLEFGPRQPEPGIDWKRQYEAELRTVRDGVKLLEQLNERIQTSATARHTEGYCAPRRPARGRPSGDAPQTPVVILLRPAALAR